MMNVVGRLERSNRQFFPVDSSVFLKGNGLARATHVVKLKPLPT
jgi:hypothetical protein